MKHNTTQKKQRTNKKKSLSKKQSTRKPIFTEHDYNSNDGMMTSIWGPTLWHSLHTISFNYPTHPTDSDKKHYKDFMSSLVNVLPCKYCRNSYLFGRHHRRHRYGFDLCRSEHTHSGCRRHLDPKFRLQFW